MRQCNLLPTISNEKESLITNRYSIVIQMVKYHTLSSCVLSRDSYIEKVGNEYHKQSTVVKLNVVFEINVQTPNITISDCNNIYKTVYM